MSALWEKEPQTLSEVIAALEGRMDWNYRTYASYLRKLCEIGAVGFEMKGRDRFYYPLVSREQCIQAESRDLIRKVSKKSAKDLLICMIRESGLSRRDHAELQSLLEELSEGDDPNGRPL